MSRTDVERFARDLAADAALAAQVAKDPTLPAVVALAARRGYDFSADEAASFLQARKYASRKPLSDADLDAPAGGRMASPGGGGIYNEDPYTPKWPI